MGSWIVFCRFWLHADVEGEEQIKKGSIQKSKDIFIISQHNGISTDDDQEDKVRCFSCSKRIGYILLTLFLIRANQYRRGTRMT
jgi:hypothetical protein